MEEEVNLKEVVKGIWKRKLIIIFMTVIFLMIGILYSGEKIQIPVIEKEEREIFARTSFTVVQTENYRISENTSNTYLNILKTTHNLERIIEKFELDMEPKELYASIWIRRIDFSDVFEIGITNEDLIDDSIGILGDLLNTLNNELKNTYSINDIYVMEKPIVVDAEDIEVDDDAKSQESGYNVKKIIVITLAGVVLGGIIVIGLEILDGSIKNENQIVNNLKITNLAIINSKQNEKELEEELRKIKLNIKNNKSILITSLINNRKNEVISGMTELYAKYGKKIALIDITGECLDVHEIKLDKEGNYKKIELEKNSEDLVELLETEKIKGVLKKLNDEFDIVIINANDISKSINSLSMSKFVDGVICIVEERKTNLKLLEKTVKNLEKIDGKLIGTIISKK